jgi:hypothetical protein
VGCAERPYFSGFLSLQAGLPLFYPCLLQGYFWGLACRSSHAIRACLTRSCSVTSMGGCVTERHPSAQAMTVTLCDADSLRAYGRVGLACLASQFRIDCSMMSWASPLGRVNAIIAL